jgi:MFS family permease
MVNRLLDLVLPARLGRPFRWLVTSSWVSNLGDGLALAAGPLLVASLTPSPFLVALATTLQWLPPLVLGLLAGAITDRHDRRRIVVGVDSARIGVLVLLTATIMSGHASIGLVLVAMFVLGTAEVFADNAQSTMLPMVVARHDLATGNQRLQVGFLTLNQLAGPPIGAALFVVGAAVPFGTQAALGALAVGLVAKVTLPARDLDQRGATRIRHDIAEGFRWTVHHPAVRTLILTIFTFNVTFGAAWSVLVLYASERLRLGAVGYGLIATSTAVGGLIGSVSYGWLIRHLSLGQIMRIGLIIETLTHLSLALTTTPWVAMAVFVVFGAHGLVWGTTSSTVRQRAVPTRLQGRVGSVNMAGITGGLVLGSLVGGALAERWGVVAPFWFAFVGSTVLVLLIWRELRHIAHDADRDAAEPGPGDAGPDGD